jgi:hypothetical protein
MKKFFWGAGGLALATVVLLLIVSRLDFAPAIRRGLQFGLAVALAQSLISAFAIRLVWHGKIAFLAVWTAGFLFRLAVLLICFFWLRTRPDYHLIAAMGSLIGATMLLMIAESLLLLDSNK